MSAVHDGHGPLRCHDGCPAYAEFMAEMHDQMRPAEPPVSTGAPESKAAPGMVDVLAAHEFRSGAWGMCATCSCDEWESRERFYEGLHAAHRAHVAAILAARIAEAQAAAAERIAVAIEGLPLENAYSGHWIDGFESAKIRAARIARAESEARDV